MQDQSRIISSAPRLHVTGTVEPALMEQNQQPDGSIKIPDALVPHFGASEIR